MEQQRPDMFCHVKRTRMKRLNQAEHVSEHT
jgi:hypothetical protein